MVRFLARREEREVLRPRLRDQDDLSFRAKRSGARNLPLVAGLGRAVILGLVCPCFLRLVRLGFPVQQAVSQEPVPSSPVRSDDTFQRVEALVTSRQFDAAERLLQQDLPAENAASAYLRLGPIYFDHKEWSRAAVSLQKSLELIGQNDRAHLLLGLTGRESKKPENAEAELQKTAQDDPVSKTNAYLAEDQLMVDEKAALRAAKLTLPRPTHTILGAKCRIREALPKVAGGGEAEEG
jgi:tetratricopeptide (TPR) repeat protein